MYLEARGEDSKAVCIQHCLLPPQLATWPRAAGSAVDGALGGQTVSVNKRRSNEHLEW